MCSDGATLQVSAQQAHGAGRHLPRGLARRRLDVRTLRRKVHGVTGHEEHASALRDEAPGAYKDIEKVLRAQGELVRVVGRSRPIVVHKGT